MTISRQIDAVLFDLDGTLLDTAPDMAAALNRLLVEQQLAALPYDRLRPVVSHGSLGLITVGFGDNLESERLRALTERFLDLYAEALAVDTVPFNGVDELLDMIESRGLRWGIVTNKPKWLTDSVLEQLRIFTTAGCVISGDSLPQRKPHPAPLQHAARLLETDPANCIYVGDAERDIEAGRAAGMLTLVARYGYIDATETPDQWQADGMLDEPMDLHRWIANANAG